MITRKGSPDKLETLDKVGAIEGVPLDFFKESIDYIQKNQDKAQTTSDKDARAWKIEPKIVVDEKERTISGKILYGEAGSGADLLNINTNNVDYKMQPHHAAMMPYYFLIL